MADLLDRAIELDNQLESAGLALTLARDNLIQHLLGFSLDVGGVAVAYRRICNKAGNLVQMMEVDHPEQRQLASLEVFEREVSSMVLSIEKLMAGFTPKNNKSDDVFKVFVVRRETYWDLFSKFTSFVDKLRLLAPIATRNDVEAQFVAKYIH